MPIDAPSAMVVWSNIYWGGLLWENHIGCCGHLVKVHSEFGMFGEGSIWALIEQPIGVVLWVMPELVSLSCGAWFHNPIAHVLMKGSPSGGE